MGNVASFCLFQFLQSSTENSLAVCQLDDKTLTDNPKTTKSGTSNTLHNCVICIFQTNNNKFLNIKTMKS